MRTSTSEFTGTHGRLLGEKICVLGERGGDCGATPLETPTRVGCDPVGCLGSESSTGAQVFLGSDTHGRAAHRDKGKRAPKPDTKRYHSRLRGISMPLIVKWTVDIEGRSAGLNFQHDRISSRIFWLRPIAMDPGSSGVVPSLNRTGTFKSEYRLYGSFPVKTSMQRDPKDQMSAFSVTAVGVTCCSGASQRARVVFDVGLGCYVLVLAM